MNLRSFLNQFLKSTYGKSIRWNFFSIIVGLLKQVLLIPLILLATGKDTYSIWLVLIALVNMVRAINVGQLNYSSNMINLYYAEKKDIKYQIELAKNANIIMGGIQLIVILILMNPNLLSYILKESRQTVLDFHLSYSLFFLAVSFILYQYCSLFLLRLFEPIGKINLTIKYQTIGEFIDFIGTAIFFCVTKNILWTAFGTFVLMAFYCIFLINMVSRNIPFAPKFGSYIDIKNGFRNIKKSFMLTISFLIEKLNEVGLNLFVIKSYNRQTVPLFNTLRTISNFTIKISNSVVIPVMPKMQKYYIEKDNYKIQLIISRYWIISTIVLLILITVFYPLVPKIYKIWTMGKIEYNTMLMFYLFIGVIIQSLSVIVVEILKKTNLAHQILFYNLIKIVTVIVILFIGGILRKVEYIGLALLFGEMLALTLCIYNLRKKEIISIAIFFVHIITILVFGIMFYLYIKIMISYLLFIVSSLLIVGSYSVFMKKCHYSPSKNLLF